MCVWGEVEIVEDTVLGLKTNKNSTNWYAKIGTEDKHAVVAGCQIHYAVKCNSKPDTKTLSDDYSIENGKLCEYKRPVLIYIAE